MVSGPSALTVDCPREWTAPVRGSYSRLTNDSLLLVGNRSPVGPHRPLLRLGSRSSSGSRRLWRETGLVVCVGAGYASCACSVRYRCRTQFEIREHSPWEAPTNELDNFVKLRYIRRKPTAVSH